MAEIDFQALAEKLLDLVELKQDEDGDWEWDVARRPCQVLSPEVLAWWKPLGERYLLERTINVTTRNIARNQVALDEAKAKLAALEP